MGDRVAIIRMKSLVMKLLLINQRRGFKERKTVAGFGQVEEIRAGYLGD